MNMPAAMFAEEWTDRMDDLRETLAALEHEQWAHWTRYLLERGSITPSEHRERWTCQVAMPYAELSEAEKASDRGWADRVLALLPEGGQGDRHD